MKVTARIQTITNEGISTLERGGAARIEAEDLINPSRRDSIVASGSPKDFILQTVTKIAAGTLAGQAFFEVNEKDAITQIVLAISREKFTYVGNCNLKPDFILTLNGKPFLVYDSVKKTVYYSLEDEAPAANPPQPVDIAPAQGRRCTIS